MKNASERGKGENFPRLIITATGSSCGKTTVTCAILKALVDRGLSVASFKCGPDYIDTMFHGKIVGEKSRNLDPYFFSEEVLKYIFAKHAGEKDISVIEGVMGYYDGIDMSGEASTYEVSHITESPAVMIVDAKGAALSVIAEIAGFLNFKKESELKGVIFNRCTESMYEKFKKAVVENFGERILPLGFLPNMPECSLESRHLGLVTAEEVENLSEKLTSLARCAEKTIDMDGIIRLADTAPYMEIKKITLPKNERIRIAVARDKAFSFYYEDSLGVLEEMGAELVNFSPINDKELLTEIHGIYLGGGYPELYAEELSRNKGMLSSIKNKIEKGLPCIAECGGYMYLTQGIVVAEKNQKYEYEMAGVLPGKSFDTGKLVRFGYAEFTAKKDNMLCKAGEKIRGHEFHHWDTDDTGNDFVAVKPSGKSWDCAFLGETLYAGYPHFHFYSNLDFAKNFYAACLKEKLNG